MKDTSTPLVSVCIVTYQHARFIGQAIDGALAQKTNFPIEILIGEDESNDGTRETCLDYERRHPNLIRVFLRKRSDVVFIDGRPRGSYNFRMTLREANGEFIALCEGDDYWTDPEKLQRQVDYLRENPDCVGCFHDTKQVDGDGKTLLESYFHSDQEKFSQQDVLATLMSREPTCSLVFRKAAFVEPLPEWFLRRPSDFYIDILLTNYGSLGFIRRNMGVYRKHGGGIWSGEREASQIVELIVRYKLLLAEPYFLEKYRDLLLHKLAEFQAALFTRRDAGLELKRLTDLVEDQTKLIASLRAENARLSQEATLARADAELARLTGQKHIDELLVQLKGLSATAEEQVNFINTLSQERDRHGTRAENLARETQEYLRVIAEQTDYIKALEAQRAALQAERKT